MDISVSITTDDYTDVKYISYYLFEKLTLTTPFSQSILMSFVTLFYVVEPKIIPTMWFDSGKLTTYYKRFQRGNFFLLIIYIRTNYYIRPTDWI